MGGRSSFAVIAAAVVGAASVLAVQWFVPQSKPLPAPVALTATQPVVAVVPALEIEPRLRMNACRDLYSSVCFSRRSSDPTGGVRRDSEGEVAVLRIYENLIRTNPTMPMEKIDELLVEEIYTPTRTKRIRALFENAREMLLSFMDRPPFSALTEDQRRILKDRIASVRLELPPPGSVYSDEPDLITRNDAFYERLSDGRIRIRLGGALLFTVKSKYNLAFTLAHELAHSIDPCELRSVPVAFPAYTSLIDCLGVSQDLGKECSQTGELAEIFADWAATHIVAELLNNEQKNYSKQQVRSALFNSVRDLCQDDDEDLPLGDDDNELSSSHPKNEYRVNRIFAQHPTIQSMLGCPATMGPLPLGVSQSCFWPISPVNPATQEKGDQTNVIQTSPKAQ